MPGQISAAGLEDGLGARARAVGEVELPAGAELGFELGFGPLDRDDLDARHGERLDQLGNDRLGLGCGGVFQGELDRIAPELLAGGGDEHPGEQRVVDRGV